MSRKPKDSLLLLMSAVLVAAAVCAIAWTKGVAYIALPSSVVCGALLLRLVKVGGKRCLEYVNGPARFCKGRGIEIGSGANPMLKSSLLVDIVADFSSKTPYRVDYIADAHSLPMIENCSMDYVAASHVLEHLSDPIRAILEWLRVTKPGGTIWLRIPDMRKTFDRTRQRTKLDHLIDDFKKRVPVDDPTHVEDCNKNSTPPRSEKHPYIHHHVWVPEDIAELLGYIDKHLAKLRVVRIRENTCRNSQDFWVAVKKI